MMGVEVGDAVDDILQLFARKLREDRQRQRLGGGALGLWKITRGVAQRGEALLLVQRHGIVDLAAHAALAEVFLERIALREAPRCWRR